MGNNIKFKIIRKWCMTIRQAERFQNKLYNQYKSVELTTCPIFRQEGSYFWRVY
jgi:hypothetical protein